MSLAAHEMRNYLAVAVANLEAILDGKMEPTPARLRAVLRALRDLDALIGRLPVERSATLDTEAETIDVCDLIAYQIQSMEPLCAAKNVRLSVTRCPDVHAACGRFSGDPVRLGQIIKNLMLNAIEYSPPASTISVDCHRGPGRLELRIGDEGPGLSDEDLERIFDTGYRGSAAKKTARKGSGLGLAVTKKLVEAHGGRIDVYRKGQGAQFLVQLTTEAAAVCDACAATAERNAGTATAKLEDSGKLR